MGLWSINAVCLWNGGMLLAVPPQNTSLTCPHCDYIAKENRKTQAHS